MFSENLHCLLYTSELAKDQPEIIVCDTVSTEDIDNRLDELIEKNALGLLAGCAGLADRLVDVYKRQFSHNTFLFILQKISITANS